MDKLKSKLNYYKEVGCSLNAEEVKKILEELEKKDKMIDLMDEYIGNEDTSEEFCFTRYKKWSDGCDENCELCVRKYFEERCK